MGDVTIIRNKSINTNNKTDFTQLCVVIYIHAKINPCTRFKNKRTSIVYNQAYLMCKGKSVI